MIGTHGLSLRNQPPSSIHSKACITRFVGTVRSRVKGMTCWDFEGFITITSFRHASSQSDSVTLAEFRNQIKAGSFSWQPWFEGTFQTTNMEKSQNRGSLMVCIVCNRSRTSLHHQPISRKAHDVHERRDRCVCCTIRRDQQKHPED